MHVRIQTSSAVFHVPGHRLRVGGRGYIPVWPWGRGCGMPCGACPRPRRPVLRRRRGEGVGRRVQTAGQATSGRAALCRCVLSNGWTFQSEKVRRALDAFSARLTIRHVETGKETVLFQKGGMTFGEVYKWIDGRLELVGRKLLRFTYIVLNGTIAMK